MNNTHRIQKQQEAIRLQSRIDLFFKHFTIGTLLNRSGIRKVRGVKLTVLVKTLFSLPFKLGL